MQVFLEMRGFAVRLIGGVIGVDFKEIPLVGLVFVGCGVEGKHARFFGKAFCHFCFDDMRKGGVVFWLDAYGGEIDARRRGLRDFFVGEVLRLDVVFAFVVAEDFWRGFAEFLVLRRLDVRLVGGIIGVDFYHVGQLRIFRAFDGIHGERAWFVGKRGEDVFCADLVVGGSLAVGDAEFKDVVDGGGEGGHSGKGEAGKEGFVFHALVVRVLSVAMRRSACALARACWARMAASSARLV